MKKDLHIKKLSVQTPSPELIPSILKENGIEYTPIDTLNWADAFPYLPSVKFGIAHNSECILLHYIVEEKSVRAVGGHDRDHMWEDSCVEFFCAPGAEGDDRYYNLETNCIGHLYACIGSSRSPREFLPDQCYEGVKRWASIGNEPFEEKMEKTKWELALVIPASTYYLHGLKSFDGAKLRGNFYKCGEFLSDVHYVTWSPIGEPKPDYHCPKWFGNLLFE